MTTNHRPALESKRGKVNSIRDTISHARTLPQHTTLKYRRDVRKPIIEHRAGLRAVDELKNELIRNELKNAEQHKKDSSFKNVLENSYYMEQVSMNIHPGDGSTHHDTSKNGYSGTIQSLENEEGDSSKENSEEPSESSSVSDSDSSDSDEDTESLMRELEKIKEERQEQAANANTSAQGRINKSMGSNPLINLGGHDNQSFKAKKSWKGTTTFRNISRNRFKTEASERRKTKDSEKQEFLDKYIKYH